MNTRSLTRAILEHLAENKHLLIDAFLPPHPRSRLARTLLGLDQRRYTSVKIAKHSISTLLCRVRKEGLVASSGTKRKTLWRITRIGKQKLKKPPPQRIQLTEYVLPPEDAIVRIVSFDIPEKQRRKRDWLRGALLACGYKLLHRSVFVGRRPLPDEALKEFEQLNLMPYVHIMGLDRKGTLVQE